MYFIIGVLEVRSIIFEQHQENQIFADYLGGLVWLFRKRIVPFFAEAVPVWPPVGINSRTACSENPPKTRPQKPNNGGGWSLPKSVFGIQWSSEH
jgi:hypothetical protein